MSDPSLPLPLDHVRGPDGQVQVAVHKKGDTQEESAGSSTRADSRPESTHPLHGRGRDHRRASNRDRLVVHTDGRSENLGRGGGQVVRQEGAVHIGSQGAGQTGIRAGSIARRQVGEDRQPHL